LNSRRGRMSKTLEELGYEKTEDGECQAVYENNYCDWIIFRKTTKSVGVISSDDCCSIINMEELKAIYKYCEDNKWI
jgi:hypothetical protein